MNSKNASVLCIDDEEDFRYNICDFLEDSGYTVFNAENGKEGLESFHRHRPDIILLDLQMPDIGGLEVLSAVTRTSAETAVIVISGRGGMQDVIEALRLGAWNYLTKPIRDLAFLEHAVAQSLEKLRLIRENIAHKENLEKTVFQRTRQLQDEIAERSRIERALRESEEQYRTAIEHSNDGVAVTQNLCIKYVNQQFVNIFGYEKAEEILEKSILEMVHPDDRKRVLDLETLRQKREGTPARYEFKGIRSDDKIVYIEASVAETFWRGHRVSLVYLRDISERRLLEAQLQQAQKMEAIGIMAGGIAHDFNNILFPIFGYTEMALENIADHAKVRKYLEQILIGARRARDLVRQILTFGRQDNEERKAIQIQPVIKESLKLLRALLPATIELHYTVESGSYVTANPAQIHQIIMNLCTNAYHAMEKKGGILEVTLEDTQILPSETLPSPDIAPGMYVKLTVSDTGIGMDRCVMERIFDPYFTTKEPGKGTGLGLSIVHGIVKSYEGHISVYSEKERGTVFHIWLPGTEIAEESEEFFVEHFSADGEHILLVDDEIRIVQMLQQMLESSGYKVTGLTNGKEALDVFRKNPAEFDLVITDMTMPKITGGDLAGELLRIRSDIPIILCTGFNISKETAKSLGVTELLAKPLLKEEVERVVKKVLDSRQRRGPCPAMPVHPC
jgi:PAS domain S-box-containing protein